MTSSQEAQGDEDDGSWSLYKMCRREHNLALSATKVRLGNLSYFQRMTDPEIGDPQEAAKSQYEYDGKDIRVTHLANFNLVFCAAAELPKDGLAGYDSCYRITHPVAFGRILAEALLEQAPRRKVKMWQPASDTPRLSMKEYPTTLSEAAACSIVVERRFIRYFPSSDATREDLTMDRIPFWKDISYAQQTEYRYLFRFCANAGLTSFSAYHDDVLDLDLQHVWKLPVEEVPL